MQEQCRVSVIFGAVDALSYEGVAGLGASYADDFAGFVHDDVCGVHEASAVDGAVLEGVTSENASDE